MALLTMKRQLTLRREATPGTYETALDTDATAKGGANFTLVDPSWEPGVLSFDRNILSASLSPIPGFFPGVGFATLQFTLELAGHKNNGSTANYVEPPIGVALSACGFKSETVLPLKINGGTAWTGSTGTKLEHGETVTGAGGATGVVIGDTAKTADAYIYVRTVSGTFVSENVTGSASATVVNITGPNTYKVWAWSPTSTAVNPASASDTLSAIYYVDGKRIKLKGLRGTCEFQYVHANPARVAFTLTGVVHEVVDGALLTGTNKPPIDHQKPPAVLGTGLALTDGTLTISPFYNAMTITLGNNVVLRENSNDSDGYAYAEITDRDPSMTINPDEVLDAAYPFFDHFKAGVSQAMRFSVGGTTAGNIFEHRLPAAELTQIQERERDSVSVWDATYGLRSGQYGSSPTGSGGFGADNELTIINRYVLP
jgi:hypothetical protein